MIEKSEYVTKYVFRERGVTIHPPYKKLRPHNFDKGQIEHKEDKGGNKGFEKPKQG